MTSADGSSPNRARRQPLLPTRGPILRPEWEGGEHTYIGNVITLKLPAGEFVAGKHPLTLPNGLTLTYGQVLALGGDFYGLPKAPICEDPAPPTRFQQAFASLASNPASVAEATKILAVMQEEIDKVNEAVRAGRPASSAYKELRDSLSERWNRITGGGSALSPWLPMGRYLELAATNWDHFCPWAWTVYEMGHLAAIKQATTAGGKSNPAEKEAGLELAYAMNAFADHYLSDMFSAGHMRTPRKQLYSTVTPSEVGSYCSRYMHDEDSMFGLNVRNESGERWTAFGDKRFFDSENKVNKRICTEAIQASANDVHAAFEGHPPAKPAAAQYVPLFAELTKNPASPENPPAMFIVSGSKVERRANLANREIYKWTSSWLGIPTLGALKKLPEFSEDNIGPFDLKSDLLLQRGTAGTFGMDLIGPGPNGFEKLWSSGASEFPFGNTDLFSTGDLNGDGSVEMVQLSGSPITATVFAPLPGGAPGYKRLAPLPLKPSFAGSTNNLLIGDVDGDGLDEVCLPCTTRSGKMGMMVAKLKGGAVQMAFNKELSAPCAYLSIGMGALDGRLTDQIVALWNEAGNKACAGVYRWETEREEMTVTTTSQVGQWSKEPGSFLCGDVDGDGHAEFLRCIDTSGDGGGTVEIFGSKGNGVVRRSETAVKGNLWWLADLDGDGSSELLALYAPGSGPLEATIWSDDGNGGLEPGWTTSNFYPSGPIVSATIDLGANFGAQYAYICDEGGVSLNLFALQNGAMTHVGKWQNLGAIAGVFGLFAMSVPLEIGPELASAVASAGE